MIYNFCTFVNAIFHGVFLFITAVFFDIMTVNRLQVMSYTYSLSVTIYFKIYQKGELYGIICTKRYTYMHF